jgi:hypothetical protein
LNGKRGSLLHLVRYTKHKNYSILAYEIPEEYTPGWHDYPGSDGNFTQYVGWYVQYLEAHASAKLVLAHEQASRRSDEQTSRRAGGCDLNALFHN